MLSRVARPRRAVQDLRRAPADLLRALARRRAGPWHAVVEQFGETSCRGWVEVPRHAPALRVALLVNGSEVMATWASGRVQRTAAGEVRAFSFQVRDLWQFCRRSDEVSVRVADARVPIVGHGLWLSPQEDGGRSLAELHEELAGGKVFGRFGRLELSKRLDVAWQQSVLSLYERTRRALEPEGHAVFLMYGTLLGAVRDGGVMGHDNDFDAAYVSRHTDPREVVRELRQIAHRLIEQGLSVDLRNQLLHIRDPHDSALRIDLFHLYFDADGTLCFPYGAAGTRALTTRDWDGVQETDFLGAPVLVPVQPERLLEVLYGAGWTRPVPGFSWATEKRVEAREARVPLAVRDEVYWDNRYAHHDDPGTASGLCEQVLRTADVPETVVDLGCGQGRDALALAAAGRTVLGVDRSQVGIRQAAERARSAGLGDRASFTVADVGDAQALTRVLEQARERAQGGRVLVYARSLLHVVPEATQEVLLGVLREVARPGDWFAAEFRTDEDEAAAKARTGPSRRLQDGPALGRRLREGLGLEVVEEQAGAGLSPGGGEDGERYRVLARLP